VIDARVAVQDLGTLLLERPEDAVIVSELHCGEQRARVTWSADGIVLEALGKRLQLSAVASASGARYRLPGDPGTELWNKGDRATLRLAGDLWPECAVTPAPALIARGNEPGWRLDLDAETLTLSWDYGAEELAANTPAPVFSERVTSYGTRVGDRRLVMAVHDRVCADDMTGMPHPKRVIVSIDDRILRGCGGEPEELLRGEWVIEAIDGRGIIDSSQPTVVFDGEGRIGGRGSCNSYGGSYRLSGEGLAVSDLFSTRMACEQRLMTQEQQIFDILGAVGRFELDETGALILHTHAGRTLMARR
jgi:heat shock protein HslJ/membrane-bound inhibitor of C-type lysozyme